MMQCNLYELRINDFIDKYGMMIIKNPNIVAIGLGNKVINGVSANMPSLTFLVRKKYSQYDISSMHAIPPFIQGVITDVVEVGKPVNNDYNNSNYKMSSSSQEYVRPAKGGVSIGTENNKVGGTFGYIVTDMKTENDIYILSAFTSLSTSMLKLYGESTLQPAIVFSTDVDKNKIGEFYKGIDIDTNAKEKSLLGIGGNLGNVAISYVGKRYDPQIYRKVEGGFKDGYYINTIQELKSENSIISYGARGGKKNGKVTMRNATTLVRVFGKDVYFRKQSIVDIPHLPGDDGAIGLLDKASTNNSKEMTAFGIATGTFDGNQTMFSDLTTILKLLKVAISVE